MEISLIALYAVLFIVPVAIVLVYNRLVKLRNATTNAYAQIDVQLKRRYDLIPNLVEVARKYIRHERETLESVTRARNQAAAAADAARSNPTGTSAIAALGAAEAALGNVLGRLMVVVEQYPELKADQNMRELSEELVSTENRIGFARTAYNDAMLDFNNAVQVFPANVVAGAVGFHAGGMLESTRSGDEREAPKVAF